MSVAPLACEAPRDGLGVNAPQLPNLSVPQPTRGAFLGVWGPRSTSTMLPLSNVTSDVSSDVLGEDRVWFVGGAKGARGEEDTSLIAVYTREERERPQELREPSGALSLHYEMPGGPLWWVWGSGARGEVWAVGEGGAIWSLDESGDDALWRRERVYLDPHDSSDTELEAVEKLILWGVWGARDSEGALTLWAVGGSVRRGGPRGVLLRRDQEGQWRRVTHELFPQESSDDALTGLNLYKIWGRADQVWIVGEGGLTLTATLRERSDRSPGERLSLEDWQRVELDRPELLFTVTGSSPSADPDEASVAYDTWVVGGYDRGRAWRWRDERGSSSNSGWDPLNLPVLPALNGVHVSTDLVIGVGQRGVISAWHTDIDLTMQGAVAQTWVEGAEQMTLHSVYRDEYKGYWIVGGDLSTLTEGVIISPDQWDATRRPIRRTPW